MENNIPNPCHPTPIISHQTTIEDPANPQQDDSSVLPTMAESNSDAPARESALTHKLAGPPTPLHSDNPVTSKPLTDFTCFGILPPEMRCMVWNIAATSPRVFSFDIHSGGPYWVDNRENSSVSNRPIRSTLFVNKESRAETLRSSNFSTLELKTSIIFSTNAPPFRNSCRIRNWQVPFNSDVDIFHFQRSLSGYTWQVQLCDLAEFPRNYTQLEKVKRLAIQGNHPHGTFSPRSFRHFPNLTELILYGLYPDKLETGKFRLLTYEEMRSVPAGPGRLRDIGFQNFLVQVKNILADKEPWLNGKPRILFAVPNGPSGELEEDSDAEEKRLVYG